MQKFRAFQDISGLNSVNSVNISCNSYNFRNFQNAHSRNDFFFLSMTLFIKNLLRNHLFERFNSKDLTKFLTENLRIGLEFYETQNADFLKNHEPQENYLILIQKVCSGIWQLREHTPLFKKLWAKFLKLKFPSTRTF